MNNTLRRAVGVGLLSLFALACGGAPAGSGIPTGLPSDLPTLPPVSIPSVSIVPDQPLEDLFPDTIGGNTIDVESAQGQSVLTLFNSSDPSEFNAVLTALGTTVDQVSAAFSFNLWPGATEGDFTGLSITALRVRNVPAAAAAAQLVNIVKEDVENAQTGSATIGGKTVISVTNPEDSDDTVYLYPVGDVTFLVGGTAEHVAEALSQLP